MKKEALLAWAEAVAIGEAGVHALKSKRIVNMEREQVPTANTRNSAGVAMVFAFTRPEPIHVTIQAMLALRGARAIRIWDTKRNPLRVADLALLKAIARRVAPGVRRRVGERHGGRERAYNESEKSGECAAVPGIRRRRRQIAPAGRSTLPRLDPFGHRHTPVPRVALN